MGVVSGWTPKKSKRGKEVGASGERQYGNGLGSRLRGNDRGMSGNDSGNLKKRKRGGASGERQYGER